MGARLAVVLIAMVMGACPGSLTAQPRDIHVMLDENLVTWQTVTPGNPWNISPVTVRVLLSSNTPNQNDSVELWAYFEDANGAISPPAVCLTCASLPSTNFQIEQDSAAWMSSFGWTPVNQTGPYGSPGGSLLLARTNGLKGVHFSTFSESFNLNLTGVQSVAAGTYLGTLFLRGRIVNPGGVVKAESNVVSINLVVNSATSLTVAVSPEAVYWNSGHGNSLVPGGENNVGTPVITLTLTWQVAGNVTALPVYAFFSDPQTALASIQGEATIPASIFLMRVDAGAYQPVLPTGGAIGYRCIEVPITDTNRTGSQSYQLQFNINLSSRPLPAGDYSGKLYLQAEAVI